MPPCPGADGADGATGATGSPAPGVWAVDPLDGDTVIVTTDDVTVSLDPDGDTIVVENA